ncbi:MAG: SoxR reducing system RseC family protein [candidate division WOR-3 bacterium]
MNRVADENSIEEPGRVVMVRGQRAVVEVVPHDGCEQCSAAGICNWSGSRAKRVLAWNRINAQEGDNVIITRAAKVRTRSALLVFGLPALLMLAGVVLGRVFFFSDTWAAGLAGVGLIIAFVIIKLVDKAIMRSGTGLPEIVRRMSSKECKGAENEKMAGTGRDSGNALR